jgi:hypothetical protein
MENEAVRARRIYVIEQRGPMHDWGVDEASPVFTSPKEADSIVADWNERYAGTEHRRLDLIPIDQSPIPRYVEALEKIAGFAPGNGDVCEIIAKIARLALYPIEGDDNV